MLSVTLFVLGIFFACLSADAWFLRSGHRLHVLILAKLRGFPKHCSDMSQLIHAERLEKRSGVGNTDMSYLPFLLVSIAFFLATLIHVVGGNAD